jgi:hypothetical protein
VPSWRTAGEPSWFGFIGPVKTQTYLKIIIPMDCCNAKASHACEENALLEEYHLHLLLQFLTYMLLTKRSYQLTHCLLTTDASSISPLKSSFFFAEGILVDVVTSAALVTTLLCFEAHRRKGDVADLQLSKHGQETETRMQLVSKTKICDYTEYPCIADIFTQPL